MADIVYLIGGGVFIMVAAFYTRFCERLISSQEEQG
jgi:hypothetical protein